MSTLNNSPPVGPHPAWESDCTDIGICFPFKFVPLGVSPSYSTSLLSSQPHYEGVRFLEVSTERLVVLGPLSTPRPRGVGSLP